MEKLVIVVEVPKLKISNNISIKIVGPKYTYYLYPDNFLKTLKEYNDVLKVLRSPKKIMYSHKSEISLVEKNEDSFSYIITEMEINVKDNSESIFDEIRSKYRPLLIIFSLLLRELFFLNKISIYRKDFNIYKLLRDLEVPTSEIRSRDITQMIQFLHVDHVEKFFPWLLKRIESKSNYFEFIEEYLTGQLKTRYLGIELMFYWNTIEHITNVFWDQKKIRGILSSETIKALNKKVKELLNEIDENSIEFKELKRDAIKKIIRLDNRIPIKSKFFTMCKKLHFRLDSDDKKLIKMIYDVRNKLFHEDYYIISLLEKIRQKPKYSELSLRDIGNLSRKIALLVEKIFLRLMKFYPYYFIIKQSTEDFHHIKFKSLNLPSILKKEKEWKENIVSQNIDNIKNIRQRMLLVAISDKKDLLRNSKYLSLIKTHSRIQKKISNIFQLGIGGTINTHHGMHNIFINFKDNLRGSYRMVRIDDHTSYYGGFVINNSKFKSKIYLRYSNFQLEFEFIKTFMSSKHFRDRKNVKIKGDFFTLMNDIKKI